MRDHHPRADLRRRREARARVRIVDQPESKSASGGVTTRQVAEVTLPRSELDRLWTPEYLERLARTYWRFLTRVSLGVLRVLYGPDSREVVILGRPLRLLTFHAPVYEVDPSGGTVTWRIKRGLLVAPIGRGKGFLRLAVRRPDHPEGELATIRVSSEVANFYPTIRGWGWFRRIGNFLYRFTQLWLHVTVTNAFLRSLARLDLAPSVVGALRQDSEAGEPEPAAVERGG